MGSYGQITEGKTGTLTKIWANPTGILAKDHGITFDWSTVSAPNSDVTLPDGSVVPSGQKYMRYGAFIAKITKVSVQHITIDAGGGTFDLTVVTKFGTHTFTLIPWNISAADLLALLNTAPNITNQTTSPNQFGQGPGNAGVTSVGLTSLVYTVTFADFLGNVALMTADSTNLTGGSTSTATPAVVTAGSATAGYYGPYDSGATDGRQNRNRGDCYFIAETVLIDDIASDHMAAYEGGTAYLARMDFSKMSQSQAEALFPMLRWVK